MIAIYVHDLSATGVVRNALAIAGDLAVRGRAVTLVTALPGGEARVPPGVARVALPGGGALGGVRVVPQLAGWIGGQRPALVVSAGNRGHATVWAALRPHTEVRRIYRISNDIRRGSIGDALAGARQATMARLLVADADRIVAVAETLFAAPVYAHARASERAVLIANGVDLSAARQAPGPIPHPWFDDAEPVVLGVGRLVRQKNFEALVDAVAVAAQTRALRLIVLGAGDPGALRARAEAHGIGVAVALPGAVADVFAWLHRAAVFALPSRREGAANVLLEALAAGVPVVASTTAGNAAQILGDGAFGRLVAPDDAPAFAAALLAQADPATAIPPGERALAYDLRTNLAAWADLIEQTIARPRRSL